jgi:hypothetical protein
MFIAVSVAVTLEVHVSLFVSMSVVIGLFIMLRRGRIR